MQSSRVRRLLVGTLILLGLGVAFFLVRTPEVERGLVDARDESRATAETAPHDRRRAAPRAAREPSRSFAAAAPFVTFSWGSGPAQLGHERREEGNAEGPASVSATDDGGVVVLDNANGRLIRFDRDGRPIRSETLPVRSAQDVVSLPDGGALVLDRLADRTVALLGPDGAPRGELPLAGVGLPETGAVTALFEDRGSVYVERAHGALVRIGGTDGRADETRPELPGRPTRDGRALLSAGIVDARAGRLWLTAVDRGNQEHLFTREIGLGEPVLSILALESDAAGRIYLAAACGAPAHPRVQLLCLDAQGAYRSTLQFPASTGPEETFRPISVAPDGTIFALVIEEAGPKLYRARCP